MITTYIPHRIFDGVKCQAIGSFGNKYSVAYIKTDGKTWNTGVKTIADAREIIEKDPSITKLVVYIYHRKTGTFEHKKTFERQ